MKGILQCTGDWLPVVKNAHLQLLNAVLQECSVLFLIKYREDVKPGFRLFRITCKLTNFSDKELTV